MPPPESISLLMIISGLDIGGIHGGAERFGLELARCLQRSGFAVTLCAFWKKGGEVETSWINLLRSEGIKVIVAANWTPRRNPLAYLQGVWTIYRSGKDRYSITHSHFQIGTLAAILMRLGGRTRQALRTAHINLEWGEGVSGWLCRQFFTKWLYPLALDHEAGVSKSIVSRLSRHPAARLLGKKPSLIYNAIDPSAFSAASETETIPLPLPSGACLIGSVGRLTRQKGFTYLIQAMPAVLKQRSDVFLLIVGDGELRPQLETQARQLGISEHVIFYGKSRAVGALMKQMRLFVLPSLWEGLPTVVLESMAARTPVLVTDIPGTRDLVRPGETGWLVPPADVQALAHGILSALDSQAETEKMVEAAYCLARQFSIEKIAQKYEYLYRTLLRKQ